MRALLIGLLVAVLCLSGGHHMNVIKGSADPCASYTPPTFALQEDFDGALADSFCDTGGVSTSGGFWGSDSGATVNCDFTTEILQGTQSCEYSGTGGAHVTTKNFGESASMSTAFIFRGRWIDKVGTALRILDGAVNVCRIRSTSLNVFEIQVDDGAVACSTGISYAANTSYWVRLKWTNATNCTAWITTNIANGWGTGTACASAATNSVEVLRVQHGVSGAGGSLVIDDIHVLSGTGDISHCEFVNNP